MIEQDKIDIQKLCLEKKAINSKFIAPESIIVGYWPRYKCQYGCAGYGKSLCCPPHSPTPDETKKIVIDYQLGLLIHFGGDVPVTKTIAELEREVFLRNYYKVIGFGSGPCKLCKECTLTHCKVPTLARASMEACGMDVYATVRNNGFSINVLKSKEETESCFGLLLIE
jgi:predicted metal-binding protein